MSACLLLITSLLTLILALPLSHVAMGVLRLKNLTIQKTFFWTYTLFVYVPSLFVFAKGDDPFRIVYLICTTSVLVVVPLGSLVARVTTSGCGVDDEEYYARPVVGLDNRAWRLIYPLLLGAALIPVILYLMLTPRIALLEAITHPHAYTYLLQAREQSFKVIPVSPALKYIFGWCRVVFLPYLAMVALVTWRATRRPFWLVCVITSTLLALVYASLSLAKLPVAWVVLLLCIASYTARRQIRLRELLLMVLLTLSLPATLMVLVLPESRWLGSSYLVGIPQEFYRRLCWVPAWVLYHYFKVFPHDIEFLHGQSVGLWTTLVEPARFFPVAQYVYDYMNPHSRVASGLANAPFIGNLYADFGVLGVLLGGFLAGLLMQLTHDYVTRKPKSPPFVAAYAYFLCSFYLLNHTAFPVVLSTNGVILMLGLLLVFDYLSTILRAIGRCRR